MLTLIIFWLANANVRGTSRERRHRDHVPLSVVAVAFMLALGMLVICLFWPYLLPLVVTSGEITAASHAAFSFTVLGAGAFGFPLMLLFAAINYTVSRRKLRPFEVIDALIVVKDKTDPLLPFRQSCAAPGSERPQSRKRDRRHHGNDGGAVV